MSLYERADREIAPRPKASSEFLFVYALCFLAMLLPAALRRLGGQASGSIVREARTMAANCAATSFMGM